MSAVCFQGIAKGSGVQPPRCQGPHSQHRPATAGWLCRHARCRWLVCPTRIDRGQQIHFSAHRQRVAGPLRIEDLRSQASAKGDAAGEFTHLWSAPRHTLYQAPLGREQRADQKRLVLVTAAHSRSPPIPSLLLSASCYVI